MLRYGVDVLSQLPNATIYLEAGASDWEAAARTAKQLRYIGISKVRGFMLNVTHHDWTRANIQHGLEISRMVGGKHFIINTSYNGRGPIHYKWINKAQHSGARSTSGATRACAASARRPRRPPPTRSWTPTCTSTGPATRPAPATAARCRSAPGGPSAALMYASTRPTGSRRRKGTLYGLFKRHSLRALGAFAPLDRTAPAPAPAGCGSSADP